MFLGIKIVILNLLNFYIDIILKNWSSRLLKHFAHQVLLSMEALRLSNRIILVPFDSFEEHDSELGFGVSITVSTVQILISTYLYLPKNQT